MDCPAPIAIGCQNYMSRGVLMSRKLLVSILIASSISSVAAEARGGGKFLGSLIARGAGRAAAGAGSSSYGSGIKTYGPDVLTVSQLAQCIRTAGKLDEDSAALDGERSKLEARAVSVDASQAQVSVARSVVDNTSQRSVDAFNVLVERHNQIVQRGKAEQLTFNAGIGRHNADVNAYNAECGKNYYPSDLDAAQALASTK